MNSIAFIGGGNMACSLIGGLLADGYPADKLWVSEPDRKKHADLQARFGIRVTDDTDQAVKHCPVVVLAVKPQIVKKVAEQLQSADNRLFISVAAGVQAGDFCRWYGKSVAMVRAMPNTPALVGAGATGLYANTRVSSDQKQTAESILRAVGTTVWVDQESQLDAVTAISGSGPAYYFLVMEAMEKVGVSLGLSREDARLLTLQTAFGAAKMALESSESPEQLRKRVTSPGGTTQRALETLIAGDLEGLFERALTGARDRSREIAEQLGAE